MPDTHFGEYDQRVPPTPEQVADAMDHCLKEAELAEKVGFDGIWVPERHQRPETWWPNTVTMLMALAARTQRVQLACTVMQPTFHDPIHLAEALAAIDNLSRGRFVFGAGVGYHEDYFRCFWRLDGRGVQLRWRIFPVRRRAHDTETLSAATAADLDRRFRAESHGTRVEL
jgi:alkanesulfonate monooxygenase SsuD/methylene tetrahydromethanopterin reductase-like flavin-dependent oxidoreductase (luciferase family)